MPFIEVISIFITFSQRDWHNCFHCVQSMVIDLLNQVTNLDLHVFHSKRFLHWNKSKLMPVFPEWIVKRERYPFSRNTSSSDLQPLVPVSIFTSYTSKLINNCEVHCQSNLPHRCLIIFSTFDL